MMEGEEHPLEQTESTKENSAPEGGGLVFAPEPEAVLDLANEGQAPEVGSRTIVTPQGYSPPLAPEEEIPAAALELPSPETLAETEPSLLADDALEPPSDLSIDELLHHELLAADLELPEASASTEVPEAAPARFSVRFQAISEAARQPLCAALEAAGAPLSEAASHSERPSLSQLNEYQVIAVLQAARSLGVRAVPFWESGAPLAGEDDLALGELSSLPEKGALQQEGAPSMVLARGEKDVLLCTPEHIPALRIQESRGIVMAHVSLARRLFRDEELQARLERELASLGAERTSAALPKSQLEVLFRDLFSDLRKAALAQGANAVLGVRIEGFPESGSSDPRLEQVRLVAIGTAAVVEKA